jgi:hypothetical protein
MAMKRARAKQIAEKLNDTELWNSHGLGISMARLRRQVGLKIDDFGQNKGIVLQCTHSSGIVVQCDRLENCTFLL